MTALHLLRGNGMRRPAPGSRVPGRIARRRRGLTHIVRAIRCGLSMPDSAPARQARLLADVFGPQLGLFDERHEPLTLHVVSHVDGAAQPFLPQAHFTSTATGRMP